MKTIYARKRNTVITIETGVVKGFKSVNEAKRESAALQKANGGLGRGSLVKS